MHDKVCPPSHIVNETCPVNNDSRKSSEANNPRSNAARVPPATSHSQEIPNRITFFRPFETDENDSYDCRPPCIITSTLQQLKETETNTNISNRSSTNSLTSQNNDVGDCTCSSHANIQQICSMHQTSLTDPMSASYHGDNNTNHITEEDDRSTYKTNSDPLFHPECQCCSQQSQETSLTNIHADCTTLCHTRNGRLREHMVFRHQDNLETYFSTSEHKDNLETCDSISEHQDNLETCDSISEQHTLLQPEATERSSTSYFEAGHESYRERIQDGNHIKLSSNFNPPRQWINDTRDFPNSGTSVAVPDHDNTATLRQGRHVSSDASCEGLHIRDSVVYNTTDRLEEKCQVQANLLSGNYKMSERITMTPADSSQYVSSLADNGIDDNSLNNVTTSEDDTDETLDDFKPDLPTDGVKRRKRQRNRYSPKQLVELERLFSVNRYPDVHTRVEIANRIGVLEARVLMWFQNRRRPRSLKRHRPQTSGMGHVRHPIGPLFTRTEQDSGTARMHSMRPHLFSIPMMAASIHQPHARSSMGIPVLPGNLTFTDGGSYRPHMIGVSPYNTLHGMSTLGLPSGVSDRPMISLPASTETHFQLPESDSDSDAAEK